jgi:hypothetical protein
MRSRLLTRFSRLTALILFGCLTAAGMLGLQPQGAVYAQPEANPRQDPTLTPEEWPETQGTPPLALTPMPEMLPEEEGDTRSALLFGLLMICTMGILLVVGIGAAILMDRFQKSRIR